jgi:hypothetical protein
LIAVPDVLLLPEGTIRNSLPEDFPMSIRTAVSTTEAPAPASTFSQAVRKGPMLQVAGQGAMDPATGEYVFLGDVKGQTERTLRNVEAILTAAGATFDDVIMKTFGLFVLVLAAAAGCWYLTRGNPGLLTPIWVGGMLLGLVIGLAIAFMKTISVPLILLYAVVEGGFVGAFSQVMEQF